MFDEQFIPQLFGLLSFVIGAACFMQKDDRRFKYLMLALNINHTLHFVLMGAMTSAISSILSASRTLASMKTSSKYVAFFFIFLLVFTSSFWANYWYDWLCVIGASIGTYSLFCLQGIKMRLCMMVGTSCWLVNNIFVGSIGGVMLETMVLIISMTTVFRIYRTPIEVFPNS